MANHTGKLQPTPVLGTKGHPVLQAPEGTKLYTTASCDDGNGGMVLAYPIEINEVLNPDKASGLFARSGYVLKYVPAAVAARDLSWWPSERAPRAATQDEADAFFSTLQNGNQQDGRGEAGMKGGDEAYVRRDA